MVTSRLEYRVQDDGDDNNDAATAVLGDALWQKSRYGLGTHNLLPLYQYESLPHLGTLSVKTCKTRTQRPQDQSVSASDDHKRCFELPTIHASNCITARKDRVHFNDKGTCCIRIRFLC